MALSEIEKLERRYAENPQGLTFAPLAEVHRKNGDVARALELLRAGLTLHPDYIPASIVLGRCHFDLGDLPAAETAFTHVLALDGENVIALKGLADITERQYRFDESERWLRTLLTVDRSNDEARDQLGRVEASRRQAEVASSAAPDAPGAVVADEAAPAGVASAADTATSAGDHQALDSTLAADHPAASDISVPPMPEPPEDTMLARVEGSGGAADAEAAPLELEELDLGAGRDAEPSPDIEVEQPVTLEEPVEPLSGLVGRDDQASGSDLHVTPAEWQVETAEDIVLESSGGSEFQVANAADELLSTPISRQPPLFRQPEPLLPDRPPVEHEDLASESPVVEPPGRSEPDLVVTESMAELLLQQGHTAEALTVFRHLEGRTAEARFRDRIAELERTSAPVAAAPVAEPATAEPPEPAVAAPPAPAFSVQQTQGQSVQAFLRGVLGARPPAAPSPAAAHAEAPRATSDASAGGAPTRPAHDSLSLSSVFGEESTPTPPAVPAGGPASVSGQGGVSYDEFFGAAGAGPSRPARTPDSKSDDLDQFHAWLQNLKR